MNIERVWILDQWIMYHNVYYVAWKLFKLRCKCMLRQHRYAYSIRLHRHRKRLSIFEMVKVFLCLIDKKNSLFLWITPNVSFRFGWFWHHSATHIICSKILQIWSVTFAVHVCTSQYFVANRHTHFSTLFFLFPSRGVRKPIKSINQIWMGF